MYVNGLSGSHGTQVQKKTTIFTPILPAQGHTGSVVERRSLTGELSLVCTGPAADG